MHLSLILVVAAAVPCAVAVLEVLGEDLDLDWEQFKQDYRKVYTPHEEPARRALWEKTAERVRKHNLEYKEGKHNYTMAINHLADMTAQEYETCLLGFRQDDEELQWMREGAERHVKSLAELPDEVDWREEGYVTPVKDQKCCGSCWAFSTTGSLEGQHFRKTGNLTSLSEQNLVDCSKRNKGCCGGRVGPAFTYIRENGGIDTEDSYPYEARCGGCRFKQKDVGATLKDFRTVEEGSEDDLLHAVATVGPVSVAIDANHISFRFYSGGIYDDPECSSEELDHAVLVVGYGSEDGIDYWIVKNSWGEHWGEAGYVRMARNRGNQCGIATMALYPVV